MDISVVIVNWNVKELLQKCLESVFQYQHSYRVEVIVIDNASSDDSVEMIRGKFPQVQLIENEKNIGFAAANNQGIKMAKGRYIFALNPDTEIKENTFQVLIQTATEYPKAGMIGCKLLNPDNSTQNSVRRDPTTKALWQIALKIPKLIGNTNAIKNYLATDFNYQMEQEVEQIMGACMFIKKEMLNEIGLFDESFFIWFEEVDLCKRARNAGWNIIYTPKTHIVHYGGESFKQELTLKKQKMFFKSALIYLKKHS